MNTHTFPIVAGLLLMVASTLAVQANTDYQPKGLLHLDEEIILVDPAAALTQARAGFLTLPLLSGPVTFSLHEVILEAPGIQYFTVTTDETVTSAPAPVIATFQGNGDAPDKWAAFTIAHDYFGGAAQTPASQRVFESFAQLPDGRLLVRTYSKTLQDLPSPPSASMSADPAGPSPASTTAYTAQTLRLVADGDARFYASKASSTSQAYAAQRDYVNRASPTYTGINIAFSLVQQWVWTSGGPTHTDCGYYRDYQSSHWSSSTHGHSSTARDVVMMFTYIRGPMTWYGSGSAGGCAFQAGLDAPLTQGYTVVNTDDTSNIHWKLAHELGHVVDADHDTTTIPGYTCTVDNYNTNYRWPLMGGGTDRCRLTRFGAAMEARVRNCVEDRPNC